MLVTPKKAMKNWLGGFELLTFSKATTSKDGVVAIMQTGAKSLSKYESLRVILVNMEISVILGHEKTKIRNIIDYGKIDVFSVRTNIHIKNKMMGHLI